MCASGASGRGSTPTTRASSACARTRKLVPGSSGRNRCSAERDTGFMAEPAAETVTLFFSDIEGSTRLLQRTGDAYANLLAEHRRLLGAAFERHGAVHAVTEGDSFFVVFPSATQAAAAATEAQRSLAEHPWPDANEVRVRI